MSTATQRGVAVRTIVWLLAATAAMGGGAQVGIGTPAQPGAGFFPFVIGLLLAVLAIVDAAAMLRAGSVGDGEEAAQSGEMLKRTFVIGAVILYAVLLPLVGSVTTIAVLTFVLLYPIEKRGLLFSVIVAAGTAGFLYYVFEVLLLVPLPIGSLWTSLGVM